ncbi:MAG: chemotaxis protein CheB [Alkalispirochaeta sp.]
MNAPIRLAVYSGSPLMRTLLVSAFQSDEHCVVIESGLLPERDRAGETTGPATTGSAPPPATAANTTSVRPEVLLLDIEPSDPEQIAAARRILRTRALPALVFVANLTPEMAIALHRDGIKTVRRRPDIRSLTSAGGRAPLVDLLRALQDIGPRPTASPGPDGPTSGNDVPRASAPRGATPIPPLAPGDRDTAILDRDTAILVIGASTGGPQAVRAVLEGLPSPIPAPVLIVQHISHGFADGFVRWLRDTTYRSVEIARHGSPLVPDRVYVAPSGIHLVCRRGYIELVDGDKRQFQRPSADVLFESAAESYGADTVGVLLTGMGRDGAEGCRAIRERRGYTLVQDEATSVVYGMPRAAAELGAAREILPLDRMGQRAGAILQKRRSHPDHR